MGAAPLLRHQSPGGDGAQCDVDEIGCRDYVVIAKRGRHRDRGGEKTPKSVIGSQMISP